MKKCRGKRMIKFTEAFYLNNLQVDAITGEECDYGKMEDESIRCSLWLRKEGMKPGDIVCLFTHNHLASYIPCLATFYNRAVLCPSFSGHSLGENLKKN